KRALIWTTCGNLLRGHRGRFPVHAWLRRRLAAVTRHLRNAWLHVREDWRFSDGLSLFSFCLGLVTESPELYTWPTLSRTEGRSGKGACSPTQRPFRFPHGSSRWVAGEWSYPFPPWLLAERPAFCFLRLDRVDNFSEFRLPEGHPARCTSLPCMAPA